MGLLDLFGNAKTATRPLGADNVYSWFKEQIEAFDYSDRCLFTGLETQIAMLWRLSSYFPNMVITQEMVQEWRETALKSFDRQSAELGDTNDVTDWRISLASTFDRLIKVLPSDDLE